MIDSMTDDASWLGRVYSPHMLHTNGAWFLAKQGFGKQEQEYLEDFVFLSTAEEAGRREIIFILCSKMFRVHWLTGLGFMDFYLIYTLLIFCCNMLIMFFSQTASGNRKMSTYYSCTKNWSQTSFINTVYTEMCLNVYEKGIQIKERGH